MDRYLQFLCDIVDGEHVYNLLLKHLHGVEFYAFVSNDDNRGEDGKKLREIFKNESRSHIGSSSLPQGPCTMLEMLIGLSYRIENELEGGKKAIKCPEAFWMLIHNLDLTWCTDGEYFQNSNYEIIDDAVSTLLDRKYDRNGIRGLFPLNRGKKDQRVIEIWYQMQEYLMENYDF